ncbi:MAG: hypothetical protein HRF43_13275 [Phycisphaerae bacterium]
MHSSRITRRRTTQLTRTAPVLVCLAAAFARAEGLPGGTAASASTPATAPAAGALLIVAPQRFHDALKDFVAFKSRLMKVELAGLESILKDGAGADDPERLKRFLYAAWKERRAGYCLLVGDADVLPVRYMVLDRVTPAAFDYAFYPSDLYYADLAGPDGSFDDWNARKDGFHARYYGEVRGEKNKDDPINFDAIDYRPELALGRWPVSTPEEVRMVAGKSMRYERSPSGSAGGGRRAAFIMVGGWVDARARMDRFADRLPSGWTIEKRYYTDKGQTPATPPPDEKNVVELLNGGVRLMLHAGHGQDHRWEQSLTVRSLQRLTNADRLPIILSAGCSTARFATLPPYEAYVDVDGNAHVGTDKGEVFTGPPPPPAPYQSGRYNPPGLGEQLLRAGPNGAVAYFGCNTGSQPCGLTLLEGFVDALARSGPSPRLGDCWKGAVAYYYDRERLATIKPTRDWYPASIFFQGMKFMLFGDPTLPVGGS